MKKLQAGKEKQYRSNGQDYYKTVVRRPDGSVVSGTRSLSTYTGKKLERQVKNLQDDISNGAWSERI